MTVVVQNSTETTIITSTGTFDYGKNQSRLTIDKTLGYDYEIKGDSLTLTFMGNSQLADDELWLRSL